MTQAFTVFLEELWLLWEAKISGQEANVKQKQESIHITKNIQQLEFKENKPS